MKIELHPSEPIPGAKSTEIANSILARYGLIPRKIDAKASFAKLLLEFYEHKKYANREKKPELGVLTVEEMAMHAGIKRQTMYEYLGRWLNLNVLKKTSFVSDGKVVVGYELNGTNLEGAFKKAEMAINNHLQLSMEYIQVLQSEIKKEKLRKNTDSN